MTNDVVFTKLIERIDVILKKLEEPIKQYCRTRDQLVICDVSTDDEYRKNFAQFYRLGRRNLEWKDHYFAMLEQSKHKADVRFFETLQELKDRTGRIEPSFSSKLVATINPQQPVIDSVVLGVLGYKQPYYYQVNRCERLNDLYQILTDRMHEMIQDVRFIPLKHCFMEAHSGYTFTDVKILDFLLWQLREPKTN